MLYFVPQALPLRNIASHAAEADCLGEPEGHSLEHEEGSTLMDFSWGFIDAPFLPPNLLQWYLMLCDCSMYFSQKKNVENVNFACI